MAATVETDVVSTMLLASTEPSVDSPLEDAQEVSMPLSTADRTAD
jgi:hypothetical protein